jgi:hypothetical protein
MLFSPQAAAFALHPRGQNGRAAKVPEDVYLALRIREPRRSLNQPDGAVSSVIILTRLKMPRFVKDLSAWSGFDQLMLWSQD